MLWYFLYIAYQFLLHNHITGCVSRSGFKLKILLPCFFLFYNKVWCVVKDTLTRGARLFPFIPSTEWHNNYYYYYFLNCILLINASFTWNADTLWWNVNTFPLASGLVCTVMSAMSQTQLSRNKLIPALFLPGITSDKHLNIGFPLWFAERFHIARRPPGPPRAVLSQFTFLFHIRPHTRSHSRLQDSPSVWTAATRVQLAVPGIGHRVGPNDRPFF